jgi:predicted  nucleic acid-binding Zn-ribbon protein
MNRKGALLPPEEDPDNTDKLPVLDLEAAEYAGQDDPLDSTGTWVQVDVATAGLRQEIEQRDAAIAELTTLLRQKSFALSRTEKDVEQARAELMRSSQAAGRDTSGLERRLKELEREYVTISALHDERRVAIAGLEDALSDAREREHQLEARIAELAGRQQATMAAHELDLARLADTQQKLAQAARESPRSAGRQEQQRLEDRSVALQGELDAAREELAEVKTALGWQYGQVRELRASLAERNARIESLLEKLRSREARRRYAADMCRAAAPGTDAAALGQRIRELEAAVAAAQTLERLLPVRMSRPWPVMTARGCCCGYRNSRPASTAATRGSRSWNPGRTPPGVHRGTWTPELRANRYRHASWSAWTREAGSCTNCPAGGSPSAARRTMTCRSARVTSAGPTHSCGSGRKARSSRTRRAAMVSSSTKGASGGNC